MEDKKEYKVEGNIDDIILVNCDKQQTITTNKSLRDSSLEYSYDLLDKYSFEYFRTLVILFHINELYQKQQKYIAEDKKPMKQIEFTKELADLYIFLDILKTLDSSFNDIVNQRLNKIENIVKEEKENKERGNKS